MIILDTKAFTRISCCRARACSAWYSKPSSMASIWYSWTIVGLAASNALRPFWTDAVGVLKRYSVNSRVSMAVMETIALAASSMIDGLCWYSCHRRLPCSNPRVPSSRYDWTDMGKSNSAINCRTISPLTPTASPRSLFEWNSGRFRRYLSARAVPKRSLSLEPLRLLKQIASASVLSRVVVTGGTYCPATIEP